MASDQKRLYDKLGIRVDSDDPTLPDENKFALLGIDESWPDDKVTAEAPGALLQRLQILTRYAHIDRSLAGELQKALQKAKDQFATTAGTKQHRQELWHKRQATLRVNAVRLHQAGVSKDKALEVLKGTARDTGFTAGDVTNAVSECIRDVAKDLGPWPEEATTALPRPQQFQPHAPKTRPRFTLRIPKPNRAKFTTARTRRNLLVVALFGGATWLAVSNTPAGHPNYATAMLCGLCMVALLAHRYLAGFMGAHAGCRALSRYVRGALGALAALATLYYLFASAWGVSTLAYRDGGRVLPAIMLCGAVYISSDFFLFLTGFWAWVLFPSRPLKSRIRSLLGVATVLLVLLFAGAVVVFADKLRPLRGGPQINVYAEQDPQALSQARALAAAGHFAEASDVYAHFARTNPDHPDRAEAQFQAAHWLQLAPGDSLEATRALRLRALDRFQQFVADNPSHAKVARANACMGLLYFELGQYQEAVGMLQDPSLPLRDPESVLPVLRTLARARWQLGEYDAAVSCYQQAAALKSNSTPDLDYDELGDLFRWRSDRAQDEDERRKFLREAVVQWTNTMRTPTIDPATKNKVKEKRQWALDQLGEKAPEDEGKARLTPANQTAAPPAAQPSAPRAEETHPGEVRVFEGVEFVWIPPGTFQMGNKLSVERIVATYGGSGELYKDAYPRHSVTMPKGFWLSRCEVTNQEFETFVNATGYKTDAEREGCGYGYVAKSGKWDKISGLTWRNPAWRPEAKHPVVVVSWNDATAYCQWLSKKTGGRYRLPSEAQWEYACRAGTETEFWWGDRADEGMGWLNASGVTGQPEEDKVESEDRYQFVAPVGSFRPNAWGLLDMHGNVWEWCQDWYHHGYDGAPSNGSAWELADSQRRVVRGGSYLGASSHCRCAHRSLETQAYRDAYTGFRLAREQD